MHNFNGKKLCVLVWIPSDNRKKIGYPVLKNFKFQNKKLKEQIIKGNLYAE